MKGHITLDNIAKKTGVSRATVHRALHGKPGVSPTVAAEICRLARELGYQPASPSALGRSPRTIVAAFPESVGDNRHFYSQLWLGLRSCLEELSAYHLDVREVPYGDGSEEGFPARLKGILKETGGAIDGLITGGRIFKEGFAMLHHLSASGVPVVLVTEDDPEGEYLCSIQSDGFVDGQMAAELLVSQTGPHQSILMCAGDIQLYSNRSCMLGFEQYLARMNHPRKLIKLYGYPERDHMEDCLRILLNQENSIGAFYSVNLRCSLFLARFLEKEGLAGKVRLIGSDLCPESALFLKRQTMTAVLFRDPALQARLGTKRLTDLLLHDMKPPSSSEVIRSSLILESNLDQYL